MRWLGNYLFELLRGPWPEMWFIRHGHGMHQIGYEMAEMGMGNSPKEALGADIPNHLISLSPLGRWQGRETKKRIWVEPDCVYTSQIRRAIETAEIIFPNYKPRQDPRLNEKDFGPAHMMSEEELERLFPAHLKRYATDGKYWSAKAPGGENYVNLYIRLHSILDTLRRDWAGKKVVIVCHSAVMVAIRQLFERFGPDKLMQIAEEEHFANCGILHYSYPNTFWGWKNGKFRLSLERAPYKLWELNTVLKQKFWKEAMSELESLRQVYAK